MKCIKIIAIYSHKVRNLFLEPHIRLKLEQLDGKKMEFMQQVECLTRKIEMIEKSMCKIIHDNYPETRNFTPHCTAENGREFVLYDSERIGP